MSDNWNMDFGVERTVVRNDSTGIEVRGPSDSRVFAREYVRVVVTGARAENKVTGETLEGVCELLYWDEAEWQEQPRDVMPTILAAVKRVVDGDDFGVEFGYKAFE